VVSGLAAASYLAAGVCTRFGIYLGGVASAKDPRYVVRSQTASHAL
jgi:hypothetical protein